MPTIEFPDSPSAPGRLSQGDFGSPRLRSGGSSRTEKTCTSYTIRSVLADASVGIRTVRMEPTSPCRIGGSGSMHLQAVADHATPPARRLSVDSLPDLPAGQSDRAFESEELHQTGDSFEGPSAV